MITVALIGGMGNQMFQYAAGKALAERHGVDLALDLSGFRDCTLRPFLLDRLRVPEAVAAAGHGHKAATEKRAGDIDRAPCNFVRARWKGRIDRLLGRAGLPKLARSPQEYHEPHFHYDPAFEALGPQTTLVGYFQSERYFGSIADGLRDWLSPLEPFAGAAAEMLGRIQASTLPISLHVRRGDYLNPGTAEFHGIVGKSYYREALGRLEGATGQDPELFVFSDDLAVAEEVLNFVPKPRLVLVRGVPERPWEDMALMSHCHHHIVANSSFSWWGAWMNGSPEKIVIAPRAWFAPNQLSKSNTRDLYPAGWMLV